MEIIKKMSNAPIFNLQDLEKESLERGIPIIGREKGKWLYHFIVNFEPKNILELGTANGYSGIILGSNGGKLITVEIYKEMAEEARENFKKFGINAEVIVNGGVEYVKGLLKEDENLGSFDLIFIDFAKSKYIEVLEDCIKLVKINGFIIADNITMEGCQDFKKEILNNERLKTDIIEIRDGLSCSERIS